MNRIEKLVLLACVMAAACGGPPSVDHAPGLSAASPAPQTTETASSRKLDADTTTTTASGATFTAPKGWTLTESRSAIRLDEPDGEMSVTFVETKAPSAEKAVLSAWQLVDPKFARKPKHVSTPPVADGWDEIAQITYETSSAEARIVIAVARRKGDTWHVALLDGATAAFDRRAAQATAAVLSYKTDQLEKESFRGKTAHTLDGARLRAFETFVEEARAKTKVVGAAIAIVQDGRVVLRRGFGVADLGKRRPVSPETLFLIGSTTKSLTTLLMASLVDEKKLSWDTPVTELLPGFALADATATKQLTVRHTVCACAGLPRQDMEFLFEYAGVTPEQRVESMKTMKTTTGFGETFQYSNTMVSTGGYVAAHAYDGSKRIGPAYDEAMQTHVFSPLGMKRTTFDFEVARKADHASPHSETLNREVVAIPLADERMVIPVRPAGGAWSNVDDMAKYVRLELGKGKPVVSEANLLERRKPQVKVTDTMSYGLGLFVEDDHGVQIVHHGGNTLGFTSDVFFLPEHGVGAVVLTNSGGANAFRSVLRRKLLEILFDGRDEAVRTLDYSVEQKAKLLEKESAKIDSHPPNAWLAAYAGTYENPALGQVTVRIERGRAIFDAGEWRSAVGRQKDDDGTVKLVLIDPPWTGFELSPSERAGRPTLTLETAQQKYTFERR